MQFIADRHEGTFVDAHGVTVHYYWWFAARARAVVQIAHGLGDHAARYERLAQALVSAGYSVYADDHRGHGQTGLGQWSGDHSRLGRLGPGGLRATLDGVRHLSGIIRAEHPELPLVLLGHSWGSILAQILINTHPEEYSGAVLTGTAYRSFKHMKGKGFNDRHGHLGTTGYEWLSRDPAVSQAFLDDELAFSAEALRLFGVVDTLRHLGRPRRRIPADIPVLIQVGEEDPFGGEKSAEVLARAYVERAKLTDVELIVYPGARHEIYNETNLEEVTADLVTWLAVRFPGERR